MLKKRIIPCLDIKDGRTVKGVNFVGLIDAGNPVELAKRYVEEECDECTFFLEILLEKSVNHKELIQKLLSEANEILAIIVASIKSARNNKS